MLLKDDSCTDFIWSRFKILSKRKKKGLYHLLSGRCKHAIASQANWQSVMIINDNVVNANS